MAVGENNLHIPDELLTQLQAKAAAEGKTLEEITEETIRAGLRERSWEETLAYGRERGRASGIPEDQVPDIVKEWRREQRER